MIYLNNFIWIKKPNNPTDIKFTHFNQLCFWLNVDAQNKLFQLNTTHTRKQANEDFHENLKGAFEIILTTISKKNLYSFLSVSLTMSFVRTRGSKFDMIELNSK